MMVGQGLEDLGRSWERAFAQIDFTQLRGLSVVGEAALRQFDASQAFRAFEQVRRAAELPGLIGHHGIASELLGASEQMRRSIESAWPREEILRFADGFHLHTQAIEQLRPNVAPAYADVAGAISSLRTSMERAVGAARLASAYAIPDVLEAYRTTEASLTQKLLGVQCGSWWDQNTHLELFGQTSALADMLNTQLRWSASAQEALDAYSATNVSGFATLNAYRSFLDSAGLALPRWPKVRLITAAERQRRFRARLRSNSEPRPVRLAKSLVHRYELILREIIDATMSQHFGEDWAEERLPLCGCKDLLGKWKHRGGEPLSHADYAHYAKIVGEPKHFEIAFEAGFENRDSLVALVLKAGRLRAASHHGHAFDLDDLRDLRTTWRAIEAGLLALTPMYEVDWDSPIG